MSNVNKDIEFWYMNQQSYIKKKTRNLHAGAQKPEENKPMFSTFSPAPSTRFLISLICTLITNVCLAKYSTWLNTERKHRDSIKKKGLTYFSVQELEQDPIKFMLQIREMKAVPQNMLKLKAFREHVTSEQVVSYKSMLIFRNSKNTLRIKIQKQIN